ncbi:MAG: hypothetical protein K6A72_09715 [Lachnospiraceae bacterium]|nr:hypothetical protein [Lachnospiraceae bacterium]
MKDKRRAKRESKHLHTVFSTAIMILALSLTAGCGLGKGGQDSVSDSDASTGTLADLAARNTSDPDAEVPGDIGFTSVPVEGDTSDAAEQDNGSDTEKDAPQPDSLVREQAPDSLSTEDVSIYFTNTSGVDIEHMCISTEDGDVDMYEILGISNLPDAGFFHYTGAILDSYAQDDAVGIIIVAQDKIGNIYEFGGCTLYDLQNSTVVLSRDRESREYVVKLD